MAVGSALVVTLAFAPPPQASATVSCPDIDATPAAVGVERSAAAVDCLVNHERTSAGLGALTVHPNVRLAAQRYADDMALRNFFSHDSPEGTDPGDRLTLAGFAWSAYGENLAAGQQTPREVMAAWLDSPSHCSNLLTPMYTVAGYGVSTAGNGPYWVQEFGRGMTSGVTAPGAAPSCPRKPTPLGTPTPAPAAAPTTPAPGPAPAPVATMTVRKERTAVAASARRSGRRLRVRIVVPASVGRTTVAIRVRQRSRTVRTATRRGVKGARTWATTLPRTGAGRVVVQAPGHRSVAVRFR